MIERVRGVQEFVEVERFVHATPSTVEAERRAKSKALIAISSWEQHATSGTPDSLPAPATDPLRASVGGAI
jgi:hypothetical protein